ncbi:MAG: hypothetical protein JHC41_00080 [Nitrosopumilus sp.]|jgi:transposase-like protein|nr:hypothetical protein [Nitrosopumilus sp.]
MDQDTEYGGGSSRVKTKHVAIFLPKITNYRRGKHYKCTVCGKKSQLEVRRSFSESIYRDFSDQN